MSDPSSLPPAPAPADSGASTSAHQRRKAERPQELLDAALELFVEKGFAATRAEEVAKRAGVSKGTLYLYFQSKEELLKAVIREQLSSRIIAGAQLAAQHQGSCAELLRSVFPTWWADVVRSSSSGVFKLVVGEVRNFPDIAEFYQQEVVGPGLQLVGSIVSRGIERGEFRALPVDMVAHSILLPLVMLCIHKHSLGVCCPAESLMDPEAFIRLHIDLILQGLAQPGDGA